MTRYQFRQLVLRDRRAEERRLEVREQLRQAAIALNTNGVTVVEIARMLGWSRQSVYDLMGEKK